MEITAREQINGEYTITLTEYQLSVIEGCVKSANKTRDNAFNHSAKSRGSGKTHHKTIPRPNITRVNLIATMSYEAPATNLSYEAPKVLYPNIPVPSPKVVYPNIPKASPKVAVPAPNYFNIVYTPTDKPRPISPPVVPAKIVPIPIFEEYD